MMLSTACRLSWIRGATPASHNRLEHRRGEQETGKQDKPFFTNSGKWIFEKPLYTLSDSPRSHAYSPVKPHYGFLAHPDWVRNGTCQSLGLPCHPPLTEVSTCLPHTATVRRIQIIYCGTLSLKDRACSRECKRLPFTFFFKKKVFICLL